MVHELVSAKAERIHHAALLYTDLVEMLEKHGISITIETDFQALATHYRQASGRSVYPVFDPEHTDVWESSGFWIKGVDAVGKTVLLQAVRQWDLGHTNLSAHFKRHIHLYCETGDVRIDPGKTEIRGICDDLRGRALYHGQIYLAKAWRGGELNGMTVGRHLLPRLATLMAVMTFDPDFIFGLAPDPTVERGLIASYGFYHNDLGALLFRGPMGNPLWHETVLWSSRKDIEIEIRKTAERLAINRAARLGPQSQQETPRAA